MPMVTMCNISFMIVARMNIIATPAHISKTMSSGGILSDKPDPIASIVGIVHDNTRTVPSHANVSADAFANVVLQ